MRSYQERASAGNLHAAFDAAGMETGLKSYRAIPRPYLLLNSNYKRL
jgi:hypothetical protein